ncbi:hypothetical protein AB9P05_11205 [Roseivirga sp. BDSF3-8]|uniref:hypothetical protein n=1 Tax=Roseivirga sp. BDSF3-8 TaxID=3241598 RepID=UPI003531F3D1
MELVEIKGQKNLIKEFLMLPVRLYKDEKNWIRPLDNDIEAVFDPAKNKNFRRGEATRWILRDAQGRTIGRVAAFFDKKSKNKGNDQPTGGMGFFECINDQAAANILFDACKEWLKERGLEAMDGPINFGDRDRWWGLLVEGFTEPNYCMPYNFLYYKDLLENYGFKLYFKQYTYHRPVKNLPLGDKLEARADKIIADPDYQFRYIKKSKLDDAAHYFRTVYNAAWARHSGVKEMSELQAKSIMKQLKPVIDPKLIYFGFYKGEPVSFFLSLPELNQVFKHVNGKLNLIGKLKFLYYKYLGKNKKIFGLVFGVSPEHQGKGVDAAMIKSYTGLAWKASFPYEDIEMNWIGDFNPKMMRVCEQIGAKIIKTHITYRKLFDESIEYKRMPIID